MTTFVKSCFYLFNLGSLVERRASIRMVAKRWSTPTLRPCEKHLTLFPILGPSSLPVVVAQLDERHSNRTSSVLEWYDRHRA